MLVMMVVMLIKGHHVEVGVGVLPIERVEDVILDCDLDIVINDDGDVDGWCRLPCGSTDGVDDEGGRHKVNSCHVVNGVGVGGVRGGSMKNRFLVSSSSY